MKLLANYGLITWLLFDAVQEVQRLWTADSGERTVSCLIIAALIISAWFVLRRRPATQVALTPRATVLVVLSAVWPAIYFFWPAKQPTGEALVFKILGAILLLASSVSLRSSYSVFPAVRTIITTGPYRWIRHPMYASYLVLDFADLLASADIVLLFFWIGEAVLLDCRARVEEELLATDPQYRSYCQAVRWRLIPGLR